MLRIETFMFIGWLNFSQFLLIQPRDCVVQTMLTYRRRHPYIMPRVKPLFYFTSFREYYILLSYSIPGYTLTL